MSESASLPTREHLAALKSAREASLILRFCDGNVLSEAEMAEVSEVLPAEVLANPPEPVLSKSPDEYASELGTSRRTVFRWLELGRERRDHCPLDRPEEVLAWWTRNMLHKVPSYLSGWVSRSKSTEAVTVKPAANVSSQGGGGTAKPPLAEPKERTAIDLKQLGGHGMERSVQIMRQVVEANAQLLANAFNDPNDTKISHYQSRYDDSVETLRKAENSLHALQKARGDLAPKQEFRSDLVNLLLGLRGMMRRRADNVCATMAGELTPEQLVKLRAVLVDEGKRDEKQMRTARFWQETPAGDIQLPAA